eukprot:364918-Chlamydomonas_euryale.AAC.7
MSVVGRPVPQHRALYKGEHAQPGLSKVFDDPGMRPKVFSREPRNKPHFSLMSDDIWGAQVRWREGPAGAGTRSRCGTASQSQTCREQTKLGYVCVEKRCQVWLSTPRAHFASSTRTEAFVTRGKQKRVRCCCELRSEL